MASTSSYSTAVQELYISYFGRPADFNGLQNFEATLAAANAPTDLIGLNAAYATNPTVKALIDSFGTSAESVNLYGAISNNSNASAFVTAVFENLFNRAPAAAGLTFWVNALTSGSLAPGNAALSIAAGALDNHTSQGNIDAAAVANKVTVASEFTQDLTTPAAINSYSGSVAASMARALIAGTSSSSSLANHQANVQQVVTNITQDTSSSIFNLTTGADTFKGTSGNNIFNAVLDNTVGVVADATLNAGDTIVGAGLSDTLNIIDLSSGDSAGVTIPDSAKISSITTLNISSNSTVAEPGSYPSPLPLDVSGWAGLTEVNITASYNGVNIVVPTNATLTIYGSGREPDFYSDTDIGIETHGGKTVSVNGNAYPYSNVNIFGGTATTSVSVTNGDGSITDINSGTGKQNTIISVSATNSNLKIYSDALISLDVGAIVGGSNNSVEVDAAAGIRILGLSLHGGQLGAVQDDTATTLNVVANDLTSTATLIAGAAKSISISDSAGLWLQAFNATEATNIVISGSGAFASDVSALNVNATINAASSTGIVSMNVGAAQTFLGGSGQDTVIISATPSSTIDGGLSSHNEIVLNNISNASIANLNGINHFSILGVAGSTTGTFDLSSTPYTALDVQGNNAAGSIAFLNVATGASLSIDSTSFTNISVQTIDTTGSIDSIAFNLGTTTTYTGAYINQVTLEDKNGNGIGTVNLESNAYEGYSGILILIDNDLSTLNLTGNASLTITSALNDNSPIVSINNAAGGSPSWFSLADNFLTTLAFGGSEATSLSTLTSTTKNLSVIDSDSAAVNIITLDDSTITTAVFANTANQAGSLLTIGVFLQASLTTLSLNGNVTIGISGDAVNTGITVAGGTDNTTVTFSSIGDTTAGKVDNITLGDGNGDDVQLGAGVAGSTQNIALGNGTGDTAATLSGGTVNIVFGNGSDFVYSNQAGATLHITAGNGANGIYVTGAGDIINISAGTGANIIATGNDAAGSIILGSHSETDAIALGTLAASGGASDITHIVSIHGLNNGLADTLTFADAATVAVGAIRQITAANVAAAGGNTVALSDWVATAVGKGSIVAQSAHAIDFFQFGGNTYLVENATATDVGIVSAYDTVVELIGTSYSFAHSSATVGTLHLLG
jgi:hypothetical protein